MLNRSHTSRKSLMAFAIAAIAFAFAVDAHAAAAVAGAAMHHADALGFLLNGHGAGIAGAAGMGAMAIGSTATAGATQLAKSKMFRIAVEGDTTDGREIQRSWIEQAAANYSTTKYGARVNLEHFRGVLPDSPFKAYGDVVAVEARELDGEFAGKLGLFAQIDPTSDLVAMTKARQKIYTSCEIDPAFAGSNQAYLVGLAVTDSPASLGTEVLAFAASNPKANPYADRKNSPTSLFTAAAETVIEFEEPEQPSAIATIYSTVKELLSSSKKKGSADDKQFAELAQSTVDIAAFAKAQGDELATLQKTVQTLSNQLKETSDAFNELKTQLSTSADGAGRPTATGAGGAGKASAGALTDC